MSAAALLLAAACAARGELPEGNAYVSALVGRQRRREEALARYAYDLREIREDVAGDGTARVRGTRRLEVFHVKGRPVQKLVARDGEPLPEAERRREEKRVADLVEAMVRGETVSEEPAVRLSRILERYDFRAARREEREDRCTLVLTFGPRPGERDLDSDRILRRLAGTLWVDEDEREVVRIEVRNLGTLKVAFGLGATVSTLGFTLSFARVEDGLWLPARMETEAAGRRLLFKSFRTRTTMIYGPYRRFEVDVEDGAVAAP